MTKTAYIGIFALLLVMFLVSALFDVFDKKEANTNASASEQIHATPQQNDAAATVQTTTTQPQTATEGVAPTTDAASNPVANSETRPMAVSEATRTTADSNGMTGGAAAVSYPYEVQKGDICWNLAKKFYGDATKWTLVKKDNPTLVGDNGELRVGTTLNIRKDVNTPPVHASTEAPGAAVVQAAVPANVAGGAAGAVVTTQPSATAPSSGVGTHGTTAASAEQQYVVKKGDICWDLAKKFYNDGTLWTKIRDANPGKVGKNGELKVGVTIVIPRIR